MLSGVETVALTDRQEVELEEEEVKMLRFTLGVMKKDQIRNQYIRGTAQGGGFGDKARETRLRWSGHVWRRDAGILGEGC